MLTAQEVDKGSQSARFISKIKSKVNKVLDNNDLLKEQNYFLTKNGYLSSEQDDLTTIKQLAELLFNDDAILYHKKAFEQSIIAMQYFICLKHPEKRPLTDKEIKQIMTLAISNHGEKLVKALKTLMAFALPAIPDRIEFYREDNMKSLYDSYGSPYVTCSERIKSHHRYKPSDINEIAIIDVALLANKYQHYVGPALLQAIMSRANQAEFLDAIITMEASLRVNYCHSYRNGEKGAILIPKEKFIQDVIGLATSTTFTQDFNFYLQHWKYWDGKATNPFENASVQKSTYGSKEIDVNKSPYVATILAMGERADINTYYYFRHDQRPAMVKLLYFTYMLCLSKGVESFDALAQLDDDYKSIHMLMRMINGEMFQAIVATPGLNEDVASIIVSYLPKSGYFQSPVGFFSKVVQSECQNEQMPTSADKLYDVIVRDRHAMKKFFGEYKKEHQARWTSFGGMINIKKHRNEASWRLETLGSKTLFNLFCYARTDLSRTTVKVLKDKFDIDVMRDNIDVVEDKLLNLSPK